MADDKVSVNTEGMAPAVDGFKSLGDRLVQITSKLEHTLDSLGTPWGDDKNGHAFFKQYGTARDQTLSGVTDMADVVHSVGQGVRQMIDAYEKVEEHNQELARKMQLRREGNGDGGGGGGGGDNYGGGDDQKVPLQPRLKARELTKQTPAVDENGHPLEPLQPTLRRAMTSRLPAEPAVDENGHPLEPLQPREFTKATRGLAAVDENGHPLEPLQPREFSALRPAIPAEPAVDENGHPLEPLQPREFIPATPTIPAESRFAAEIPAERGELIPETPALPVTEARSFATPMRHLMPREGEVLLPTEPAKPLGHMVAREGEALLPAERDIPTEPLIPAEPLHRADGVVTPPSHVNAPHLTSRFVAQPDPGEATLPRHEGVPAEPLVRADGVATPRLHRGFAELEPESFIPVEPAIPAEPEK